MMFYFISFYSFLFYFLFAHIGHLFFYWLHSHISWGRWCGLPCPLRCVLGVLWLHAYVATLFLIAFFPLDSDWTFFIAAPTLIGASHNRLNTLPSNELRDRVCLSAHRPQRLGRCLTLIQMNVLGPDTITHDICRLPLPDAK